jgi:hypothetical protein
MKHPVGFLKDHPGFTNSLITVLVAAHAALTYRGYCPDIWHGSGVNHARLFDIYVAMLTVAALQASFAGIIVIFGLSTQPSAFRQLRIKAGGELVNNWLSISNSGFISAAFALTASLTQLLADSWIAPWLFELSVCICVHGILRLLWLLKCLIGIVQKDDVHKAQEENARN